MSILNKSQFDQCNVKIIKLIRQKIYPKHQHKHSLPKIKTYHHQSQHRLHTKYVQIEIQQQHGQTAISEQTDIQQQLQFNAKQNRSSFRLNNKIQKRQNLQSLCHQNDKGRLGVSYQGESQPQNECYLTSKQKNLLKQYDNNINYLSLFKHQITNKKRKYLQQIKLSDFVNNPHELSKCNFEYLVHKMATEQPGSKKAQPYEDISPNHLSEYLELLQPNRNNDACCQIPQLQKVPCDKQRKRSDVKKGTLVLELGKASTQGISAKLRLKANHKKMIELIKN